MSTDSNNLYVVVFSGWLNSAINPFIYASYSPDFRTAFWRLTLRRCCPRTVPPPFTPALADPLQQSRGGSIHSSCHRPHDLAIL